MSPLPDYRKVAPARALLGWKQKTLAGRIGTSIWSVCQLERGNEKVPRALLFAAFGALRDAGIEFHDRGVSLREAA